MSKILDFLFPYRNFNLEIHVLNKGNTCASFIVQVTARYPLRAKRIAKQRLSLDVNRTWIKFKNFKKNTYNIEMNVLSAGRYCTKFIMTANAYTGEQAEKIAKNNLTLYVKGFAPINPK